MKGYRFSLMCFMALMSICIFSCTSSISKKNPRYEYNSDVKTRIEVTTPSIDAKGKRKNGGICWVGKLCWMGSYWERQVGRYYDNNISTAPIPPLEHPVWDYVENLPAPDFKGVGEYDSIYAEYFYCNDENQRFDFRPRYQAFIRGKEVKNGDGYCISTGNINHARKIAKMNALKNIAEQFGVKISSDADMINYSLVEDKIFTETNQSVELMPAIEQYHNQNGQDQYQVVVIGIIKSNT